MNKLFFALPAVLFSIGCAAQQGASENAAPTENVATEATAPQVALKYQVSPESAQSPEAAEVLRKVQLPPPPDSLKVPNNARIRLTTSKGPIVVELNTTEAPLHTKSFYYLTQKGYFNGTRFHRWANLLEGGNAPGYIIQGGDPLSKVEATRGAAGSGGPGYRIPREHNKLVHDQYVIAAARTADPDSAGSQFYITQNPVYFLDEGDGYTVFGKIVEGQNNAIKLRQDDQITKAEVVK
jgi:cyclophilin family peptidyl-prolyl cis-trans isomerase